MVRCPACARPVAVARPTCLYCGAALPPEVMAQAQAARRAAEHDEPTSADGSTGALHAARVPLSAGVAPSGPDAGARLVVVVEVTRADPALLSRALGLPAYEGRQRVQRGGWQLLRVGAPPAAQEVAALAAAGARIQALYESEVRAAAQPLVAAGGSWSDGRLHLRAAEGRLALAPGDLLLVVRGPIARQFEARPPDLRRRHLAAHAWRHLPEAPEPGQRIHLHRRDDARPVELDPQAFEFGRDAPGEAPVLALARWTEALAAGAPIDEGFRHLTPALGPAQPETGAAADLLGALRQRRGARGKAPPALLDNLAQFRFYSAWRACVERRNPGSFTRPREHPTE